jgi:hypothetical protein
MKELQNAKERDEDDWIELFGRAHPNFKLNSVQTPLGSALSIIEVVWEGDMVF